MAKQLLVGDYFVFETRLNTHLVALGLFGARLHPVPELQPGMGTLGMPRAQTEQRKWSMCWFWWSRAAEGECPAMSLTCSPLSSQDSARAGTASRDRRAQPWGSSCAHPGTTEMHGEGAQVGTFLFGLAWCFLCEITDYLGKGAAGPCPDIPVPLLFCKRNFLSGAASQFICSIHQCPPSSFGRALGHPGLALQGQGLCQLPALGALPFLCPCHLCPSCCRSRWEGMDVRLGSH